MTAILGQFWFLWKSVGLRCNILKFAFSLYYSQFIV